MPPSQTAPAAAHWQALIAFLHGIEPRAWVFALNQAGEPVSARAGFESGLRDFVARSQSLRLAQWPMQFWSSLLRQPPLLAESSREDALGAFGPGPRAALLLRLIAGLDFSHASQILGVSEQAYEAALRQALDHPRMDDQRMQELRDALHTQIHQMPEAKKQELAALRTAAMASVLERPSLPPPAVPVAGHSRKWLWGALVLLLTALVATFLLPGVGSLRPGQREALPEVAVGPAPELTDSVVVIHPDYLQLAHPELRALVDRLGFLSWLAAAGGPPILAERPVATSPPLGWNDLGSGERRWLAPAQAAWTALDPAARLALVEQVRDWEGKTSLQREELRERMRQWDSLDPREKARRRVGFSEWRLLSAGDQQRVRAAAATHDALPALQRQPLREQFAALPHDTQRLWALGPGLGQEFAPIAPLFAFLPEDDRPRLLAVLRGLDGPARADLVTLAPRLDEKQRQELRRQLLSSPPTQRAALIRQRLAQ